MRKLLLPLLVVCTLIIGSVCVLADGEGNTIILRFAGVPSGTCSFIMLGLNTSNGNVYTCPAGSWVLSASGFNPASPGPIGGTSAAPGTFTNLTYTNSFKLPALSATGAVATPGTQQFLFSRSLLD